MSSITPTESAAIQRAVMVFLRRRSLATVVLDVIFFRPWKQSSRACIQFESIIVGRQPSIHFRSVDDSCRQATCDYVAHRACKSAHKGWHEAFRREQPGLRYVNNIVRL